MTEDEAAVRAVIEEFAAALREKDAVRAIATLASDVVAYDLAPPLAQGPEVTTDPGPMEQWFATWEGPIVSEAGDLTVEVGGDVAYAYGLRRLSGVKVGEGPQELWFRATVCLRRSGSAWRITHMHDSVPFAMDGSAKALLDLKP